MAVVMSSIAAVVRDRASLQPNDTAFTFVDFDHEWDGVPETLTWAQLYRRTLNLAQQLQLCGSTGDRAVILAPQGLDYVVSFLGAAQAGFIPVPLSVPQGGASDERVSSVLGDSSPSVVLTVSSVVDDVAGYTQRQRNGVAPSVVEVDLLDLDSRRGSGPRRDSWPDIAYLQYTSGSTRAPAGVMLSHKNVLTNFEQLASDYFAEYGGVVPPDTTMLSWLPLYHDMGLVLGVVFPILAGIRALLMSPVAFLQRPARWVQFMGSNDRVLSGGPNFAFELAARKTSDDDMAGLDLGTVVGILNGSERVQPATLQRFADRFARFNLPAKALRPSYGLAEATVYVATRQAGHPPKIVHFESEELSAGNAIRCASGTGTPLVSYGRAESPTVLVVDPETSIECPAGAVGEIWVHGGNVAAGYWQKPAETERTFGATLVDGPPGTPAEAWLRTGDQGFFSDGELFIIGRIKDLLIVYGRNHSPDDIEATVQDISGGRCVAIAVPDDGVEKLVVIVELKKRGDSHDDVIQRLEAVKREVTSAISTSHGLSVSDLVLVSPGSIPITTSGKVRRAQCVEMYRRAEFTRLDALDTPAPLDTLDTPAPLDAEAHHLSR